ncbi:hypothetical protein D3C83_107930 [compost metagenome]
MIDGLHRDRIDHLLMELRVQLRWRQAVAGKDVRIIQVDGSVETAARRIVVDNFKIVPNRADHLLRIKASYAGGVVLPRDRQRQLVELRGLM